jgi:ABC-type phosphate transport system substrate-binding protein
VKTVRTAWVRLMAGTGVALAALCAGLLVPAQAASAASYVPISGAGSTWSATAIEQWINSVAQFGLPVSYVGGGSTLGRSQFAAGVADWAASEIPYGVQDGSNADPPPTRGYAYVPDMAGGLAFMYHLTIAGQRVDNLRLSGAVIAGIFTNKITMWNDPAVAADNPGLTLPAEPIVPVVRSDGSGTTAEFTQWMLATESSYWDAYCAAVGRNPCTQTSAFPVQPGTDMIGQSGDTGVSGYVAQAQAEGAIGYVGYSSALRTAVPVAKVLNAAGYYTLPTADNVAVSLLQAQIVTNPSDPLYLTADLSKVYTDTDPRTYELSFYSYLIVPTDSSDGFNSDKGYTLGAFGQYLLCQGQQQLVELGYSPLPISLAEDGFGQLQKIPGNQVTTPTTSFMQGCNNPTYSADGSNALADNDPMPQACDQQGTTQCPAPIQSILASLTASPDPATVGQTVTLTAIETASDGSNPAGSFQFEIGGNLAGTGGTPIGSPVAVDANGRATTTTSFAAAGTQTLSAVFTPTNTNAYTGTVALGDETVQAATASGSEPLAVTIPATGSFTLTVATGTVTLAVSGADAIGTLFPITVTDTRNTFPGWSVSGQTSDFSGSGSAAGSTISGNQLGWVPAESSLGSGAVLGGTVTPASPGLGSTAAVLASALAGSGNGTNALSANLTLDIPASAAAGPYAATLTLTAVTSLP